MKQVLFALALALSTAPALADQGAPPPPPAKTKPPAEPKEPSEEPKPPEEPKAAQPKAEEPKVAEPAPPAPAPAPAPAPEPAEGEEEELDVPEPEPAPAPKPEEPAAPAGHGYPAMLFTGAAVLGASWIGTIILTAVVVGEGAAIGHSVVPIAGPVIELSQDYDTSEIEGALVGLAAGQAAGAVLLFLGLTVFTEEPSSEAAVMPTADGVRVRF
jgi:hypothetical protein